MCHHIQRLALKVDFEQLFQRSQMESFVIHSSRQYKFKEVIISISIHIDFQDKRSLQATHTSDDLVAEESTPRDSLAIAIQYGAWYKVVVASILQMYTLRLQVYCRYIYTRAGRYIHYGREGSLEGIGTPGWLSQYTEQLFQWFSQEKSIYI